ncbi:MAG: hypothetical protein JJU34_04065 [Lunatimonas sp.]|uniref:hypothetical protein n=1 Tax=Lunatimonas sp. TaxID=2060141 RepID=UPI00263B2CEA|nr:hypothetical protein [Lunatimonas sp.]MCC5936433.1 hypothetical protein [Lunatimonas sp.]
MNIRRLRRMNGVQVSKILAFTMLKPHAWRYAGATLHRERVDFPDSNGLPVVIQ